MSIYDIIAQSFYTLNQQCFAKVKIQEVLKGKNSYATDRSTRTEVFGLLRYSFIEQKFVHKSLFCYPRCFPKKQKAQPVSAKPLI